ncbi:hypothetical protein AVMA1855_20530 [Acidovorax sp. SUPP1855]|uniref:hypothetical protein n=1 Tax=Acidovorax sp. SUPP1855 TaxID=431774 RepID=UPI0023DE38D8|nr:hypothetical protein [Acidovorax sp. SUPP1855]GKS86580.1 hypothetical protein AVMA1855_20530 [Acidovorax sp. SUPP1855]
MMRRSIAHLLALVCAAFLSCLAGGFFFVRTFQAGDCDGGCNISALVGAIAGAWIAFLGIGHALMRRQARQGRRPFAALAILSLLTVAIPASLFLGKTLRSSPLRANQDNSYMLIAVRDLPALGITTGQRCIFSSVDCSTEPARIDAVCTQGAVTLKAPQWSAFQRLPNEDFGIAPTSAVQAFPKSCPGP